MDLLLAACDSTGETRQNLSHEMQMHLDVTALPTGLYTLKIHGGDGVMAQRWVKE
ncbi:MAG: T9SS type A sorting domain-containing protein [Flavobacteriales bacterium]|nr:T9SS type A sorting domain-containing protein [Flavobacteriales bacterium]